MTVPDQKQERLAQKGLLHSAGIVSAAVAFSRITGFARETVLGWLLGAGAIFDAYVLGYRVPNLARDLFAEGALASAFVPAFTRALATGNKEDARELSNITATLLLLIVGSISALGMWFSPVFVEAFASDFHAIPGKFELAVRLVRIVFPFLPLVALAAQAQGILYAHHRFGLPAVSSSLFNIGSILFGITVGYWAGPQLGIQPVEGMAAGIVFGGIAQLLFQLPAVWKLGYAWRPRLNLQHEGVRQIFRLMGPAIISGAAIQINVLVNTNFAAGIRDASGHVMNGPVSWLAYAFRFQQLPLGLFGIPIAAAALPRLSRSAAAGNRDEFRDTLARAVGMSFLATVPAAVGLAILSETMVGLVYEHGRFLPSDTRQTAIALTAYAIGIPGYALVKLLSPAFYALGDSRTPMLVSVGSILFNAVCAFTAVEVLHLGTAGVALSLSLVAILNASALLLLMSRKIAGLHGTSMVRNFAKVALAASAMAVVCLGIVHLTSSRSLQALIGIPCSAAVYYLVATALRIPETATLKQAILAKLKR
ncbi:MAG: murein biosynthesis integral rane protein MurJ [Bryobacterales bacterium]|nr:murein biosynthesis integral rane protein MurJ [Bryobacterales bacterium]